MPHGKVAVIGEVTRPGLVDYQPGMTLLEALKAVGGLTPFADPARAAVLRYSRGLSATAGIRLDQVIDGRMPDQPLEDGDLLGIPTLGQ